MNKSVVIAGGGGIRRLNDRGKNTIKSKKRKKNRKKRE